MSQSQSAFVPRHFVRSTTEPGSPPQALCEARRSELMRSLSNPFIGPPPLTDRTTMSDAFVNMMRVLAGGKRITREDYIATLYAGRPPVDENGDLPAELEADLPIQFQRCLIMSAFPVIAVGKCVLCGNGGLHYDAGGVRYCEHCGQGFLDTAEKYMTEGGYLFFVLNDGTVSDGDMKWPSVTAFRQKQGEGLKRLMANGLDWSAAGGKE